jgi:hypothetical protein
MTTATAAHRRITPAPADVDRELAIIDHFLGRYCELTVTTYIAGYLCSLVKQLADEHANRCRTPICTLCWRLRSGLAMAAAFDTVTGGGS